eukprot:6362759-Heterocapsa_arctica.AAC.1
MRRTRLTWGRYKEQDIEETGSDEHLVEHRCKQEQHDWYKWKYRRRKEGHTGRQELGRQGTRYWTGATSMRHTRNLTKEYLGQTQPDTSKRPSHRGDRTGDCDDSTGGVGVHRSGRSFKEGTHNNTEKQGADVQFCDHDANGDSK